MKIAQVENDKGGKNNGKCEDVTGKSAGIETEFNGNVGNKVQANRNVFRIRPLFPGTREKFGKNPESIAVTLNFYFTTRAM